MDYQELLFAAEVRKAAYQMYQIARAELLAGLPDDSTRNHKIAEWEVSHPFEGWFEKAYRSITWAADVVRDLRKK